MLTFSERNGSFASKYNKYANICSLFKKVTRMNTPISPTLPCCTILTLSMQMLIRTATEHISGNAITDPI